MPERTTARSPGGAPARHPRNPRGVARVRAVRGRAFEPDARAARISPGSTCSTWAAGPRSSRRCSTTRSRSAATSGSSRPALIDWLNANVADPRFEFHRPRRRQRAYNPTAQTRASSSSCRSRGRLRPHLPVLRVHPPCPRRLRRHAPTSSPTRRARRDIAVLALRG